MSKQLQLAESYLSESYLSENIEAFYMKVPNPLTGEIVNIREDLLDDVSEKEFQALLEIDEQLSQKWGLSDKAARQERRAARKETKQAKKEAKVAIKQAKAQRIASSPAGGGVSSFFEGLTGAVGSVAGALKGGEAPPPPEAEAKKTNLPLIIGGGVVVLAAIYFLTKKKGGRK